MAFDYLIRIISVLSIPADIYTAIAIFKKIGDSIKNRREKRMIWSTQGNWVLISPKYITDGIEGRGYRREDDMKAAWRIMERLRELNLTRSDQEDDAAIPEGQHLVFICGPKGNKRTKQYLGGYDLEVSGNDNDVTLRVNEGIYKDKSAENQDYAVVLREEDKETKQIKIFCFGIHGIGTLAAAIELTSKGSRLLKKIKSISSDGNFVIVLKVNYSKNDNHSYRIDKIEIEHVSNRIRD